jgi:hypothetical protein
LLRASLTPGSVLNEVFGKRVNNRNPYVLAPLREILSHTDAISSMSYELLRSIERGKSLKEASLVEPRHRERRICSALREIDHAYQTRLAVCISDRELQISSALRGALRDLGFSAATTATCRSSRIRSDQRDGQKEEREDQGNGLIWVPPETRLTMCDLRVTHFMCARNSLFNTMYTTTAMPL